mgnify:CR=1 FL=1
MKKILLSALLGCACLGVSAADVVNLSYTTVGLMDAKNYQTPNYYVVLSDNPSARYNKSTGALTLDNGYVLVLDLYNVATNPVVLPDGTYTISEEYTPLTVSAENSQFMLYANGKAKTTEIEAPVVVTRNNDGIYTLTTKAKDPSDKTEREITFTGRIPILDANAKPAAFDQLNRDMTDMKLNQGGIAYYLGKTGYSTNTVTSLNFFSAPYDTNGALIGDGINLVMMIAHKKIPKKEDYMIIPGTYESSTDFARYTWYPCREIDYPMDNETISIPFGSYIRIRENGKYVYGYLQRGTFTVEFDKTTKHLTGTLDAYTDMGYHITATLDGNVTYDFSSTSYDSAISNLEDDVDLDLDYLEKGRLWHNGEKGGCRSFILDLGSPAGRDSEAGVAADIIRIEFLTDKNECRIKPGLYTVAAERWDENELKGGGTYEPMSLHQGWAATDGGTRYAHFQEGLTYVYDFVAPIHAGTVRVETNDNINYTFEINLIDDAEFEIRGLWDNKPVEYQYNPDDIGGGSGVDDVNAEGVKIAVMKDGDMIHILNAGNTEASIYDLDGRLLHVGPASQAVPVSSLGTGVRVIRVEGQTSKIIL